jgi:molybdopterin-guanine dinucleotide biosynthesis protein
MKIFKILILILLISACNQTNVELKEQRKSWDFDHWKSKFKDRALCICLLEGYENEEIKKFILKTDKSYYSGIGIAIFDPTLKPIIAKEVAKIKQDSINLIKRVPEHLVGKKIFSHCIEFYKSERLDSIIKKEIPKWNEVKNIQAEVWKYVTSY